MLSAIRKVGIIGIVVSCVILLSGCQAEARAYVINDDGTLRLNVVPGCDVTFQNVTVKYLPAGDSSIGFDDLETVWSVTFAPGAGVQSVDLFTQVPGAVDEFIADSADLSRDVVVNWTEDNGANNAVSGVLADLQPGYVLSQADVQTAQDYLSREHNC